MTKGVEKCNAIDAVVPQVRKRFWRLFAFVPGVMAGTVLIAFYVLFVLSAGAMRQSREWPKLTSDEELRCRRVLNEYSLTPHGSVKHSMYREYSSAFFGESAKTLMYRAELMDNAECFAVRLGSAARHYDPLVIVLFDVKTEQTVLVVRNFDRSQSETASRRRP